MGNGPAGTRPSGRGRGIDIAFMIVSAALALGAFVPVLVNFLRDGHLDWSLYALGAVAMTWLIVAPWFVLRRFRAATSWGAAVLTVPLYLWLVQSLNQTKGWLLPLGLPAAALGLAALGGIVWLWCHSRIDRGYAAALTAFIVAVLSLTECALTRPFLHHDPNAAARVIVTVSLGCLSIVLALGAYLVKRSR